MTALALAPRRAAHALIRFYQLTLSSAHRPAVPLSAELLGLCGRGDRPPRPVGRDVDGRCADLPLPSVGRLRIRSAAAGDSAAAPPGRGRGDTAAGGSAATDPRLASGGRGLYGRAAFRQSPKRLIRMAEPSRAATHPRPASRADASSSSKRASTTRSARTCSKARPARSTPPARPTTSSASPARSRFPAGVAIALDAADGGRPALRRRRCARLRGAGRNLPFRDRRRRIGPGADGHVGASGSWRSATASSPPRRLRRPRSAPIRRAATRAATPPGRRSGLRSSNAGLAGR